MYETMGVYGDGILTTFQCGFTERESRADFDLDYLLPSSPCCHYLLESPTGLKYSIVATPMLFRNNDGYYPIPIQLKHPFGHCGGGIPPPLQENG